MARKSKPVVVDAIEASLVTCANWPQLSWWLRDAHEHGKIQLLGCGVIRVKTPKGMRSAQGDDMLVHSQQGELTVCKHKSFHATHQLL